MEKVFAPVAALPAHPSPTSSGPCVTIDGDASDALSVQTASAKARRSILALDQGYFAPEPIHGMTQKQFDRYLHLRMALPRTFARQLAMSEA